MCDTADDNITRPTMFLIIATKLYKSGMPEKDVKKELKKLTKLNDEDLREQFKRYF